MLVESFVASTRKPEVSKTATALKDVGIHIHEFQPIPALKSSFKKSSTQKNCLAVTATHLFAAQADKSVVHVYNTDRGNQEAVVPFPEKITSLALAGEPDGAAVLVLGTEVGRLILWELATGRQISTPQSHLQAVTCLAVDPTSNFVISGSPDSSLNLWAIPPLLSFTASLSNDPSQPLPFSPVRSLSNHRAAISAVAFGYGSSKTNIAISASDDNTCIIWSLSSGEILHTYLIQDSPHCLAVDPANRAVYIGYGDGSIQVIDFYRRPSLSNPLDASVLQRTPTQLPASDRWHLESIASPILCLELSYDGTTLLSGHEDGKIRTWSIPTKTFFSQLADFSSPVTNLLMLPLSGFPNPPQPKLKLHNVVKPRYESSLNIDGGMSKGSAISTMPANYTFSVQFTSTLPLPAGGRSSSAQPSFQESLTHPSFPTALLEEGIAELESLSATAQSNSNPNTQTPSLPSINNTNNDPSSSSSSSSAEDLSALRAENARLTSELAAALSRQRKAVAEMLELECMR
ncbi:MAG: hypothetical protein Q9167_006031, partial [Letrouitia subvulpina]